MNTPNINAVVEESSAVTASHGTWSHTDIAVRLKRAEGHLRTIIQMIEEGRDCVAIAQQLYAVEKAVENAKKKLIRDHIDHCVEDALGPLHRETRAALDEFKEITKYL